MVTATFTHPGFQTGLPGEYHGAGCRAVPGIALRLVVAQQPLCRYVWPARVLARQIRERHAIRMTASPLAVESGPLPHVTPCSCLISGASAGSGAGTRCAGGDVMASALSAATSAKPAQTASAGLKPPVTPAAV